MAVWHGERGKKFTGGVIRLARKKKKHELGSLPVHTKIGKGERKIYKTKGGGIKIKAFNVEFANVFDPKTSTTRKIKILDVLENPSNPQLVRSGIITKGCIIKTEIGDARVTSRPSQHGVVNALALEKEKV